MKYVNPSRDMLFDWCWNCVKLEHETYGKGYIDSFSSEGWKFESTEKDDTFYALGNELTGTFTVLPRRKYNV